MQEFTGLLLQLVQQVSADLKVYHRRIYLTGLSTGCIGVWALAVENPALFAAVAPMARRSRGCMERVADLREMAVWVVHGARDTSTQ